jgi:hypothetical protein
VISLLGLQTPVTVVTHVTTVSDQGFSNSVDTSASYEVLLHQVSGRDIERATGGRRTDAGLVVFCRSPLPEGAHLSYAQPGGATQRWLIIRSENWVAQGGFYRAWCVAP